MCRSADVEAELKHLAAHMAQWRILGHDVAVQDFALMALYAKHRCASLVGCARSCLPPASIHRRDHTVARCDQHRCTLHQCAEHLASVARWSVAMLVILIKAHQKISMFLVMLLLLCCAACSALQFPTLLSCGRLRRQAINCLKRMQVARSGGDAAAAPAADNQLRRVRAAHAVHGQRAVRAQEAPCGYGGGIPWIVHGQGVPHLRRACGLSAGLGAAVLCAVHLCRLRAGPLR